MYYHRKAKISTCFFLYKQTVCREFYCNTLPALKSLKINISAGILKLKTPKISNFKHLLWWTMPIHIPSAHKNGNLPIRTNPLQLTLPQKRIRPHTPLQKIPLSRPTRRNQIEHLTVLHQTVHTGRSTTIVPTFLIQFGDIVFGSA